METENENGYWRDNTVEFSAANWIQKLVLHLCNLVKTWATVLSWNQKTFPFMQATIKPLKTTGTAQFFPGSCALSTCRNSLAPRLFPPQKMPALHLYACHSSVWLCCKGVAFVHVLVFATSLHSMLLLVLIPCYFWSSFHATSGLHSIPGRLNMEQETDASLIALTTHFAQVREGYNRRSIFPSNLASFFNIIPSQTGSSSSIVNIVKFHGETYCSRRSLMPRPHPLTRKKGSGDFWPIPRASLKLIAFLARNLIPPITSQKTQSVVARPESLGYFSAMTQHFFAL